MTRTTSYTNLRPALIGHLRYVAAFSFLLGSTVLSAHAATDTWVGNTSTDWAGSNWTGGNNPPVTGDSLTFGVAGTSGTTLTDTLTTSSFNIGTLTFSSGASAYTMTGNAFNLTGSVVNSGTNNETFYNAITSSSGTFTSATGGGNLTFDGKVTSTGGLNVGGTGTTTLAASGNTANEVVMNGGTLDLGAYGIAVNTNGNNEFIGTGTVTSSGGGVITLSNDNGFFAATGGGTLVINAVISNNGNTNRINTANNSGTVVLGAANTFNGTTINSSGTVRLANSLALQNSTLAMNNGGGLTFDSSVTSNSFVLGGLSTGNSGTPNNIVLQNNAATPAAVTILVGNNNSSNTYSNVLSGSGGFTKTGTGTQTLSGANAYTGTTTVQLGQLTLDSNAGSIATNVLYHGVTAGGLVMGGASSGMTGTPGATLPVLFVQAQNNTASSQAFGSLTLNASLSNITARGNGTGNETLTLGGITHNAGGVINFSRQNTGGTGVGIISTTTSNDASGILGGWAVTNSGNNNSGNGYTNPTDYATVSGGNIVAYTGYNNVAYNATLSGTTVNNDQVTATGGGSISTTAGVTTDINTFSAAASATGGTTINIGSGGILRLGANGGILDANGAGGITVSGGTLTAGGAANTAGEISLIGGGSGNPFTLNSVIANNGTGAVTLTIASYGGGNFQLSGSANTYTGGTYIEDGRIITNNVADFGTGAVTVLPDAQIFMASTGTYINNFNLSGGSATGGNDTPSSLRLAGNTTLSGTINLLSDVVIALRNSTGNAITGQITGNYNLSILQSGAGGGAITLSNTSNNWGGNLTTDEKVILGASNVLPDGTSAGNVILNNGGTLELNGFSDTINGLTGTSTVGQVVVQNSLTASASTLGVGNNNLSFTYTGAIRDGAGSGSGTGTLKLDKVGTGTFTVGNTTSGSGSTSGTNDYTGGTQIDGGTLQLAASAPTNILGSTAGALTVNTGGTLDLNGNSLTIGNLAGTGGVITSTATGALTLTEGTSASGTFAGVIKNNEATSISLIKQGTGTTDLEGANTYTGTTAINAGTLQIGFGGSIANLAGVSFGASSSSTLALGDAGGGITLSLAGPITNTSSTNTISGAGSSNSTLTLNGAGTQIYANAFTGNLNLIIAGTATPISRLSNTNTYTGTTTVNSGSTLQLTGSLGATAVTVNSGGTLAGSGNGTATGLIGGSVNLVGGSAATLATAGTVLKTTGALTLGTSGAYNSSDYTTLNYTLGSGNATEILQTASGLTASNAFVNVTNPAQTGTFTLLNYGSLASGYDFSLSSTAGNVLSQPVGRNTETLTIGGTSLTLVIAGTGTPNVAYFDGAVNNVWSDTTTSATLVNFSTNLAGTNDAGNTVGANSDVILNANTAATARTETLGASSSTGSVAINSLRVNSNGTTTLGNPGDTATLTINALADSNTDTGGGFTGNTAGTGISIASTANAFTVNVPVVLGGSQTWTNNSAAGFTENGSVTGQPSTATVLTLSNTNSGTTTINGLIDNGASGTLAVVVNNTGSGVTTLANSGSTYSGGTTLNDGTLTSAVSGGFGTGNVTVNPTGTAGTAADAATLNTTSSIASTAAVTVNTNSSTEIGKINFNGTAPTIGSLSGNGSVVLNNSGGTTLTIGSSNNLSSTFSGAISNGAGTGNVVKAGTGTLTLSGANTYSGTTTVNAGVLVLSGTNSYLGATTINSTGTLRLGSSSSLPAATLAGGANLVINSGGTLDLNNFNTTLSGLPTGTGTITNGSATSGTSTLSLAATGTLTPLLADSGTAHGLLVLAVTGGNLTIATANTYSGGTTINGGTLTLTNSGGTGAGTIAVGSTGVLTLNYSGNQSDTITGSGTINTVDSTGNNPVLSGNMSAFTGVINVGTSGGTSGKTIVSNYNANNPQLSSSSTINVANGGTFFDQAFTVASTINVSGTGNNENFGALRVDSGGVLSGPVNLLGNTSIGGANGSGGTISGVIADGGNGYGITSVGYLTTILSGANTFSGNTSVNSGGFDLANTNALQNSTLTTAGITFDSTVTSHAFTFGGLSGSGNIALADNASTPNAVALTIGKNNSSQTYSGVLSGAGSLTLIGTGTQTITGANTYTGPTTVSKGTLQVGNGTSGSIASSSAVTVAAPAALVFDQGNGTTFGSAISNSGYVVGGEGTGITNTVSGAISGAGSFTQSGAGRTILSAANTYTGPTTINSGTLQLGINGAIGSSSAVTVANGTLAVGSFNDTVAGVVLGSVAGSSITGTTGVLTSTSTFDLQSGSVSAILGGSAGANVDGGAIVTLSGANTYTGVTDIFGNASGAPSLVNYQNGTAFGGNSSILVEDGATAQVQGNIVGGSQAMSLAGMGNGGLNGTGALENVSGNNSYAGLITLNSDALITSDTGTLSLSGGISTAGNNLTVGGPGSTLIGGGAITGTGTLATSGAANVVLTGNNTYSGSTTIASGTTLQLGNGGTSGALATSSSVTDNGVFAFDRSNTFTADAGGIGGTGSITQIGTGSAILSQVNTFSGGTSVSAGKLFVNAGVSTSSPATTTSGTGSGAVRVTGGTLAGSGNITTSSGVMVTTGGTLGSGDAQSTTSGMVDNTHLTLTNTSVTLSSAKLSFSLGSGTTTGAVPYSFGTPNTNTTSLTLAGSTSINFTGTDSLALVDLTGGSLTSLRLGTPYLLVAAGSNADYLNLVIASGSGVNTTYSLSQNDGGGINGYVLGVYTGSGTLGTSASYTAISISQYGADGVTPLSGGQVYSSPALYLNNGDLEVVPEPGTWALMIGGFGILVLWQRRKSSRS